MGPGSAEQRFTLHRARDTHEFRNIRNASTFIPGRGDSHLCPRRKWRCSRRQAACCSAGLGLKLNHIKRATRSYLRDRTNQATSSVTSYVVAAGLFAAAGIFLIAACLVGITALFRWIEINYGLFQAFGAIGAPAGGDRSHPRWSGREPSSNSLRATSRR